MSKSRVEWRKSAVWNEEKRSRFAELRRREDDDALSEAERAELARLTDELYALESSYLGPATERLQRQREITEAQNRRLNDLADRKSALVERLGTFLGEAEAERRAIQGEVEAVLAGGQDPQGHG